MLATQSEWSDTTTITAATDAVRQAIFYYLFFSSVFPHFGFI
jgi:hypothetical protein